jgi:hypothetical protein
MRATVAKRLRKQVYGDDLSPLRKQRVMTMESVRGGSREHAGDLRRHYQRLKRAHTRGK